jgi:hypothetical protein
VPSKRVSLRGRSDMLVSRSSLVVGQLLCRGRASRWQFVAEADHEQSDHHPRKDQRNIQNVYPDGK